MKLLNQASLLFVIFTLAIYSCSEKVVQTPLPEPIQKVERKLLPQFTLLDSTETNVNFVNKVEDTQEFNFLIYESFYNGGGVSVGDINNDGLDDLFFAGNQTDDKLYLNLGNLNFLDISDSSGIVNDKSWSTGVNMVDINNDGFLDIYVCKSLYDDFPELRINRLYINNGDTTFTESAADYGLNDFWRTMQATFTDFDRDGDLDVFMVNQPPNPAVFSSLRGRNWLDTLFGCRLLEFDNGRYTDITVSAGVGNRGYALSAVTADYNNDGWPDIYVANDYDGPDFLYMNNQDGTFTNKINDYMSHISYFSMGCDAGDINNDGWIDIITLDMVAEDNYRIKANMGGMEPEKFWNIFDAGGNRQYMYNTLQVNRGVNEAGNLVFSDIAQLAGISSSDWSWTPLLADFDNDGWKDIYITNGIKRDLRNTDATAFTNNLLQSRYAEFTKNFPDSSSIDLWDLISLNEVLDYMPQNKLSNHAYKNVNGSNFKKMETNWGLESKSWSSGAAYSDLDNDGDLDLVVSNMDDPAFIFRNNAVENGVNHFLRVKLDVKDNKLFNSRIEIFHNGNNQIYEFTSSRGFYSNSEQIAHFGLGTDTRVDSLIWHTSDSKSIVYTNLIGDQEILLKAEDGILSNTTRLKGSQPLIKDITTQSQLVFSHKENIFDDFAREVLIPHKMSALGPFLATGDVDKDGTTDVFIGGASGQAGQLFTQNYNGTFFPIEDAPWNADLYHEDAGSLFKDFDNDGDLDLYVVSGGNEHDPGSYLYRDRFYINLGGGDFEKGENVLPDNRTSGSIVREIDFDKDGDLDLFVGGRQSPGSYPAPVSSQILINQHKETGSLSFIDKTTEIAPSLNNIGMVTDAVWTDLNSDGNFDLVIVGEWMPVTVLMNSNGKLENKSVDWGTSNLTGWWYSISADDLDDDGDPDLVVGNLGQNYKYKASIEEPFVVHYDDFDQNGTNDIVLSYYNYGNQYPLRGRSCSSQQIPTLKDSFPTYHQFASATLIDVYGNDKLSEALELRVNSFKSIILRNNESNFNAIPLPIEAQYSNINSILIYDLNGDGNKDLILGGNLYSSEVETPINDASVGLVLLAKGNLNYECLSSYESGLNLPYDVKDLRFINLADGRKGIIVTVNNGPAKVLELGIESN